MRAVILAFLAALLEAEGWLATTLGVTHNAINPPTTVPDIPAGDIISKIWGITVWVFNAAYSIFQLCTFQVSVPAMVDFIFIVPIIIIVVIGIMVIRGV